MKKFKFQWIAIALLFCSQLLGQDQIIGNWFAKDLENSTIQVYQADDGFFYGKITACDRAEWVGTVILRKAGYQSSEQQWTGEIYSPARDMTIDATITLPSADQLKLVGKKFFMTKTFYWAKR